MVRVIAHTYHAYHASATPEELCLEAWTAASGFWLNKKRAPRQGRGHALLSHQHAIADKTGELPSHQHAVATGTYLTKTIKHTPTEEDREA